MTYSERIKTGDKEAIEGLKKLVEMGDDVEIPRKYIESLITCMESDAVRLGEAERELEELRKLYDDWNNIRDFVQDNHYDLEKVTGMKILPGERISKVVYGVLRTICGIGV